MSLRDAAQQALEALEDSHQNINPERRHADELTRQIADSITALRAALSDTQDWDEVEALRASLREHMAEIKRLRKAGWHAYYALSEINSPLFVSEIKQIGAAMSGLRAALAEDAMQRLADEQQMIERGTKAWAGVPDATAWVEELRGNEPVTDYHKKEGDNASPPLPTLAVHVGYRYQSPVGGWEYGNHIPAGFDTGAWAYQKIYILQEQS